MEVHALRKRGWSIAAIARHTGHDRKTVRKYLAGDATPGIRARPSPDPFEPFVDYVTARLAEDPHLWARTLFDELELLGFGLSYQSLTRLIRARNLRPTCAACRTATERPNAVIEHPPDDEAQWDWLELPDPPESWGWGKTAHLLVGSLAHSGKWRAALSPSEDQPHLVAAIDRVTRGLGGVSRVWRFDRMATVCDAGLGRVTATFAGVAKHYGVSVAICPPPRGNRKGVVEKINHTEAQRWWRTLADEATVEQAQADVDRFARVRGDTRLRATPDGRSSVAVVAKTEPLSPLPARPYPVILSATRTASRQALVSYRGNRYSVPPDLAAAQVRVSHPMGGEFCDIATTGGIVIARHRIAADGLGVMVRDSGHVIVLDAAAMATAGSGRPHRRKERIPPGTEAKAAAAQLLRLHNNNQGMDQSSTSSTDSTVIDLSAYERAAQNRTAQCPPARTPKTTGTESPSAAASRYQRLRSHLAELKLHAAAEALPTVLDQATAEGLSLTVALERLLAVEVDASTTRRLAGRLRFACLPTPATLADFDVDAGIDRPLIDDHRSVQQLRIAAARAAQSDG